MDLSGNNKAIVIDNGTGIIKAGFAEDYVPKCIIQNIIGRPKTGDVKKEVTIGAQENLHKLSFTYPMEHGVIKSWEDMEKVWNYVYSKEQLSSFPEEHPVLFTETVDNSRENRNKIVEIFYEKFGVPALCFSLQAVLSLYSTGRTTGIVVDVGDGVSHVVPICQGFAMPFGVKRMDFGGRNVTKYLRLLLKKEGVSLQSSGGLEMARRMKEFVCYVADNPIEEENKNLESITYALPDGNSVQIGSSRFRAPEVLFCPSLIGKEFSGLHQMLYDSVHSSDLDLRSILMKNIVISGGSTLFKGFGKRLFTEMKNICPKNISIKVAAPKERLYSAWIGGSILAKLDTFKDICVFKKDYEEKGNCHIFNKMHSHALLDQYYMMFHKN